MVWFTFRSASIRRRGRAMTSSYACFESRPQKMQISDPRLIRAMTLAFTSKDIVYLWQQKEFQAALQIFANFVGDLDVLIDLGERLIKKCQRDASGTAM